MKRCVVSAVVNLQANFLTASWEANLANLKFSLITDQTMLTHHQTKHELITANKAEQSLYVQEGMDRPNGVAFFADGNWIYIAKLIPMWHR